MMIIIINLGAFCPKKTGVISGIADKNLEIGDFLIHSLYSSTLSSSKHAKWIKSLESSKTEPKVLTNDHF